MPLHIIEKDITTIPCDVIVNPTNEQLLPTGGVDGAIHYAAGPELLTTCQSLGGLQVGQAKITPAYRLPCRFIIHTVGPWWNMGEDEAEPLLESCYEQALAIAKATKCESIAFPLISAGARGCPKDKVLTVALRVIKRFLYENEEMQVYLALFNKTEYTLRDGLSKDLSAYIETHYLSPTNGRRMLSIDCGVMAERSVDDDWGDDAIESSMFEAEELIGKNISEETQSRRVLPTSHWRKQSAPKFADEEDIFRHMYDGFSLTLMKLIDEKGLDDVECYKKANVSRQTWHKILNDPRYKPNKKTILSFAIALELDLDDTQKLLATAGFILSKSSKFDLIIMYCIMKGIYDVFEIDAILFQYDQETLSSKL